MVLLHSTDGCGGDYALMHKISFSFTPFSSILSIIGALSE
jgi:hypothetical protein